MPLASALHRLAARHHLSAEDAQTAFDRIFEGAVPAEQIEAFLMALRDKGETAEEIRGAAASMRGHMLPVEAPPGAIDIVGTGGDMQGTLNVSTAAAFVTAACGVPVAKHGNRAASSLAGSSDVLAALGVNLEADLPALRRCLDEAHICFLFAPRHHPAMRHVAPIRQKLKTRTIFNLLGPLTNPANVRLHLIGAFDAAWLEPMAQTLQALGSDAAWLAHGRDGTDEITTAAETDAVELRGTSSLRRFVIDPAQAGLPRSRPGDLKGGDAAHNAAAIRALLRGDKGPYRDIVALNAAAALVVAGKAADLREGVARAMAAIDTGDAARTLELLARLTSEVRA